jgi:hypothetical protein
VTGLRDLKTHSQERRGRQLLQQKGKRWSKLAAWRRSIAAQLRCCGDTHKGVDGVSTCSSTHLRGREQQHFEVKQCAARLNPLSCSKFRVGAKRR